MKSIGQSRYVQIDKYVFDQSKPIGTGACGTVYLGFYVKGQSGKTDENAFVAIKEIPVKAHLDITDSILQEINVLRKLKHKNIVNFIEAKKNEDYMYLVTQYCNQGTIEDIISQNQLSEEEVLGYFRQITEGFKYMKIRNIVHRDIKPQNILIHNSVIKIADFGLAKVVDPATQNRFLTFSGTPLFMSPQIIKQEPYSDLADIWSLGVTFYYMLFRHYPWNEANPLKLLKKIELKVANLIPEGSIVSQQTKEILRRMLVIEEKGRITWEELFALVHGITNDIDATSPSQSEAVEDLTVNSFLITSTSQISDQENEEIQEFGRRQTLIHQKQKNSLTRSRRARDYLEFERQNGLFFNQVAKELESQKKAKPDIPDDLYTKCMFLLAKRFYTTFLHLNQMLLFDTNQSGIIEINDEDWKSFITTDHMSAELLKMRAMVTRDYDFSRKEFFRWKDLLYDAQLNLKQFELVERGETYKDTNIEENENLILAFNDNFLKLFMLLAKELEIVYIQALEEQINISKNQVFLEKKIDFIFVYDLIIVLTFRNIIKKPNPESNQPLINFHKYFEDRKRVDPIEILHRIHKQREAWLKLNE